MMENLGDLLVLNANRYPEKTAVVYRGQRTGYRDLNRRVNRLAHNLLDLGIRKGDRVGFMFPNCSQIIELFFATQKIGALAVPMSFRLVSREVKYILDSVGAKAFVYHENFSGVVDDVKKEIDSLELLVRSGENAPVGEYHLEGLCLNGYVEEPKIKVEFDDPSRIQFTGGTTGPPKGALYTHRTTLFTNICDLIAMKISDNSEVQLNQVPMFHSAGMVRQISSVASGGTFVIVETLDPIEILRMIEEEQATFLMLLPPSTFLRLLEVPNIKDFNVTSVKRLISGGAIFPPEILLRLYDVFPSAVTSTAWGQTELGPAGTLMDISRSMVESNSEKMKSVGLAMPFVEIRLVDDEGREVPVGEVGEAIVSCPSRMVEYYNQPEITADAIRDGWVHTGDYLRKDQDGHFYFVDRKKDMIKSGGENVYAQEVERIILNHPAVERCAVIGIPDPELGEAVIAVVKLKAGAVATREDIVGWCRRDLSSHKKPRQVFFVEDYPTDAIGKIQKFRLKERYGKSS
jgi:acyl-CoA synthetase (AMP-forming)/AMP-acid ligase II